MSRKLSSVGMRVWILAAGLALAACQTGGVVPVELEETEPPPVTEAATAAPTNTPPPTATATDAAPPTEQPIAEFDDAVGDTLNCPTSEAVDVPAVDIQHITVWNAPEGGYLVDVRMGERVDETIETAFSFAINLTASTATEPILVHGFRFGIHDGSRIQGEYAPNNSITAIEGTQQFTLIDPETGMARFVLSDQIDKFRVEAFYQAANNTPVYCDPIQEAQDYIIRY